MNKLVSISIVFILLIAVASGIVQAQEGISVSSTTEVEFPSSLTFNVRAESDSIITQIFLRYRVDRITPVKVTSVVQPDFDPSPVVETSWRWEMKKMLNSLPPGTEVSYSWRVRDALDNEFETPWYSVHFNDDRYPWNSLIDGNLTLLWHEGDTTFAQELLNIGNRALDRLEKDTGAFLEQPVKIYVYASSQELRDAVLYPQEWMGGVSFSEYSTIALGVDTSSLSSGTRLLTHELAHIVTFQMTYNPYNDIPVWLNEGLSVYAEEDLRLDMEYALDRAISKNNLISVQTISSNFPVDYDAALLSYAESYSIVDFLIQQYGAEKMLHLLNTFRTGSTYDDALLITYGFDTAGLDNLWRQSLGLEPRDPSPTIFPNATPTPSSGTGLFGCQASSDTVDHSSFYLFAALGLLLLPGISEIIRRIHQRSRR